MLQRMSQAGFQGVTLESRGLGVAHGVTGAVGVQAVQQHSHRVPELRRGGGGGGAIYLISPVEKNCCAQPLP